MLALIGRLKNFGKCYQLTTVRKAFQMSKWFVTFIVHALLINYRFIWPYCWFKEKNGQIQLNISLKTITQNYCFYEFNWHENGRSTDNICIILRKSFYFKCLNEWKREKRVKYIWIKGQQLEIENLGN